MSGPTASAALASDVPSRPRLRVAVFNRHFSVTGGGAERYSVALVEQLAARHEIHVFAQTIRHEWPGVTYHRVSAPLRRSRWMNQLWFAVATWRATRRGFDVVHSHENTWYGNVQTVHVLPVKYNLLQGRTGWRRALQKLKVLTSPRLSAYLGLERLRYAPQLGRQVVVTSASLKTTMAATYPACAKALSIITPGITMPTDWPPSPSTGIGGADNGTGHNPAQALIAARQAARRQLGVPETGRCMLFVGNDYRKKGLPVLLQALAQLPADVQLLVVGHPGQIPVSSAQATTLGVLDRVHFLGSLEVMDAAYRAADLLVHPTLEDTFAMVVLEAMSYALPVVVSGPAFCGIAGMLEHENTALILPNPRDLEQLTQLIRRVLDEPALRHMLAQQAQAWAAAFDWRHIAEQQEVIYQAACQQAALTRAE